MTNQIAYEYLRPPLKCRIPKIAPVASALFQSNPKSGISPPRNNNSLENYQKMIYYLLII